MVPARERYPFLAAEIGGERPAGGCRSEKNIHRIRGEADPVREAKRCAREIAENVPKGGGDLPRFDWIFLGMGADGHTASIFPNGEILKNSDALCAVSRHPVTGQRRITFTLPLISASSRITFPVNGSGKAGIVGAILKGEKGCENYPAACISPSDGQLEWCLDRAAAENLI